MIEVNLANNDPLVYVVILNWNNAPDTIECIQSLRKSHYQRYIPLVVDNGSTNGSVEEIRSNFPSIDVIEIEANSGYAVGNNVGIQCALDNEADYVLILNNDTLVAPSMLGKLIEFAESKPNAGMVGPKMYCANSDDTIFAAGSFIEWAKGKTYNRGMFQNSSKMKGLTAPDRVDFITGCGVLVSRKFLDMAGGFDPVYFLNYEDVDWGLRAWRLGFEVWYTPSAVMWHKISGTLGQSSPANTYYMTRNGLLFFWRNSPFHLRLVAVSRIIIRIMRSIFAWTFKSEYQTEEYRKLRSANLNALRDFISGNFGQMKP
jgi:GT2 family glycosyltransferase